MVLVLYCWDYKLNFVDVFFPEELEKQEIAENDDEKSSTMTAETAETTTPAVEKGGGGKKNKKKKKNKDKDKDEAAKNEETKEKIPENSAKDIKTIDILTKYISNLNFKIFEDK